MTAPLCFVLMPSGHRLDAGGRLVDFDRVYDDLVGPAVAKAGMEPLRADEEMPGGILHKPALERLILCEYAVADLTTADANLFYGLGVRHALRTRSTLLIVAEGAGRLPFDAAALGALSYRLTPTGIPDDRDSTIDVLANRLIAATQAPPESPVFQLLDGFPDIQRLKTDVFRERVAYAQEIKSQLAAARRHGLAAVRTVEHTLGPIADLDSAIVIDLFLSYRAVEGWHDMIALASRMPRPLAATVLVREQLALALNRAGRGDEAEQALTALIAERGPSSETYGILGRVYKDQWEAAVRAGNEPLVGERLDKAIGAYLAGFETDWRDAYPGINAVTLMELRDPPDPRRERLLPIVRYAVERRIAAGRPDYWDYATLLELAVLARDEEAAADALANALASAREGWERASTARTLRLIRDARERRGQTVPWAKKLEEALGAEDASST